MDDTDGQVYRALVGERVFDVTIQDDQLIVDGEPMGYTFEVLRDGYMSMIVDGESVPVSVEPTGPDTMRVTIGGRRSSFTSTAVRRPPIVTRMVSGPVGSTETGTLSPSTIIDM